MVKLTLSILLVASLCALGLARAPWRALDDELEKLHKNAVFQDRQAKVELEMRVFTLQHDSLQGLKDEKKKECIQTTKETAIDEGTKLRSSTVGTLVQAVEESQKINGASEDEVLAKLDYENLKNKVVADFKEKLNAWFPGVEKAFAACLA
ncbi:Hypothetical protein NTJ_10374 [Nesidiocoris tenuis]|uniref:Uncharacterized protein n=1 Tax=Nesidiocoris tenuis TaxID=355587 RepID=A0ABN7B1W3_9HEMI|nr:Hypothetical protein NTJ_10374 [Nesidiocoris tenuis]